MPQFGQVPDSFVPSTTQEPAPTTPAAGGGIQPMHNAAPEQMEQMGASVGRMGAIANTIGLRIQWDQDNAQTRMAENGFLQQANQILHGNGTPDNPGYLNMRGQQAVDSYQGAAQALAKAQQQGLDSLSNPFEKQMYQRVTMQHATDFGGMMSDHQFQQRTQVNIDSASAAASTYQGLAAMQLSLIHI